MTDEPEAAVRRGTSLAISSKRLGVLSGGSGRTTRRLAIRDEVRLLRHGRDWRGRSTVPPLKSSSRSTASSPATSFTARWR